MSRIIGLVLVLAAVVRADALPENLFRNSEFDEPGNDWSPYAGCERVETMAMSGEWVYRARGSIYQFLAGAPTATLEPSTRHTLVIRARSFGSGASLTIVQMCRNARGESKEGAYVVNGLALSGEFCEYYLPFTTSADTPTVIVFYKTRDLPDDSGAELASACLYEGEVSSYQIRPFTQTGHQAPVAGTALVPPDNAYGRSPRPLKALALCKSKSGLYEISCITTGTSIEADALVYSGGGQDVYETPSSPGEVSRRIDEGYYDLYLIPAGAMAHLGPILKEKIAANVAAGARTYTGSGALSCAYLRQDGAFDRPQIAHELYRAAFGEPVVPEGATTRTESVLRNGTNEVATWTLDAAGLTVDWRLLQMPVAGPHLGKFRDEVEKVEVEVENVERGLALKWSFADFSGRILAADTVSQPQPSTSAFTFSIPRGKLYTNCGRLRLELVRRAETLDVREELVYARDRDFARLDDDFTVSCWPIGADVPRAEHGRINARLAEIGVRAEVLPASGGSTHELSLGAGLAVGSSWIGGGDTFCGYAQASNVRKQPINTAASRANRYQSAYRSAAATRKFGLIQTAVCDEPNFSKPGTADELDATPENLDVYRARMEAKYGTVAEYNRRHGTSHCAFADLDQALLAATRAAGNPAEFIEWRNFNVDRWCEAISNVSAAAKAADPTSRMSLCNSFGQSALSGNDYWKLLTKAGLDFSNEYTAMVYLGRGAINNFDEFYRSFRPDMRVWGWIGYAYSTAATRFSPWWFACHRYGGFSWYAASMATYALLGLADYSFTQDGVELKASLEDSRLMDGLGKVLTCWAWAPRDVAIYYSHDSMLLATWLGSETKNGEVATTGPLHDYMYSRQGAQYLVEDLLYQHDFVAPEQIVGKVKGKGEGEQSNDFLSSYKVLFMPRILAMSDAEVAAVKAFLAAGGKVVADELPGAYDELGVRRAENPFAGVAGVTVTGKNFDDLDDAQRGETLALLEGAGAAKVLASPTIVAHRGREAMHYVSGDAHVYAVIRHPNRSSDTDEEMFVFPAAGHVYDVRGGTYLGFTDRVTAAVPRSEGSVWAVLPEKIEGVSIGGVKEIVPAGSVVPLSVGLNSGAAEMVVHVEFVPPGGTCPFHLKRNLAVRNGCVRLDFPMARNDAPGVWTVRVREPLTGVSAERTFRLVAPEPEPEEIRSMGPTFSLVKGECPAVECCGEDEVLTFASDATVRIGKEGTIDLLVVGGGGGGGWYSGGGGGGGGVVYRTEMSVTAGVYRVVVGAGGAAGAYVDKTVSSGGAGGNSSAFGVIAYGGGGGGSRARGGNGASGGGAGGPYFATASARTTPMSYAGGAAIFDGQGFGGGASTNVQPATGGWSWTQTEGGGGGGAGGPGANPPSLSIGGAGGIGLACSITGKEVYYGGGGGAGSAGYGSAPNYYRTSGGAGGGGHGAGGGTYPDPHVGEKGTDGLGGGGGGGGSAGDKGADGGAGGSGAVIVRFRSRPAGDGIPLPSREAIRGGAETVRKTTAYHEFLEDGELTLDQDAVVDILLVGGGGSGGTHDGGGGGGGGVRLLKNVFLFAGTYPVVVGRGGAAPTSGRGTAGGDSYLDLGAGRLLAHGGGYGGHRGSNSGVGGSGGGAGAGYFATATSAWDAGAKGMPGEGHDGGGATNSSKVVKSHWMSAGGGGGGAGAPGWDGVYRGSSRGGDGGEGLWTDFTGAWTCYGGGGGGGSSTYVYPSDQKSYFLSLGGNGGGGRGGAARSKSGVYEGMPGEDGKDGLGGGGGGSGSIGDTSAPGGKGGDGCVIIRHAVLPPGMLLLMR